MTGVAKLVDAVAQAIDAVHDQALHGCDGLALLQMAQDRLGLRRELEVVGECGVSKRERIGHQLTLLLLLHLFDPLWRDQAFVAPLKAMSGRPRGISGW
jgi:hypothetical protein